MDTLEKLIRIWPIIKWLDDARWGAGASGSNIPGPVFEKHLDDRGKVLTHWLCYITDQQRPYEQVWNEGGPVFAEVVSEYLSTAKQGHHVLDILQAYTRSTGPGQVDEFVSRRQELQGQPIRYKPRFGMHQLSIARTLGLLPQYGGDIVAYLSANEEFWLGPTGGSDSLIWRMAFLLYLLSYDQITRGMLSFHRQRDDFLRDLQDREQEVGRLLNDKASLENRYRRWVRGERFHKRLWAAFRDYLKPGSYYEKVFMRHFGEVGSSAATHLFNSDRNEVLSWLELPGDTWNLQFSRMLLGSQITHPRDLREAYDRLRHRGLVSKAFYPEQFDVSFDFSPRMCDRANQDLCLFRKASRIKAYCLAQARTDSRPCPVTMILCGYESECQQVNCPVPQGVGEDLCQGCAREVTMP